MKNTTYPRRRFLGLAGIAGAALTQFPGFPGIAAAQPNRKSGSLNIALIGVQGRAANTIRDFLYLEENVVALCDVDSTRLAKGAELASPRFAGARRYQDYRKLLESERELDAVVVTTPDHMHGPISMLAMSRGLHVFCEKPLTRTVWEARQLRAMASKAGVVTQMGNQGSISPSLRRSVEIVQAGVLGDVREVHVWTDRASKLGSKAADAKEPPPNLNWDIWLGVAESQPYNPQLHPASWRWWQDFGGGALGDMACHLMNMPFRALDLAAPSEIDVEISEAPRTGMFPKHSKVDYRFPQRGKRSPLTMTWYDGGRMPSKEVTDQLSVEEQFDKLAPNSNALIGSKGILYDDVYLKMNGETEYTNVTRHEACKDVPKTLPRARLEGTRGHYLEWIDCCKSRATPYSSFEVAAALTEIVQLGGVAIKLGHKIRWDPEGMRVAGEKSADRLLRPTYRPGFTVPI